MKYTHKYIMNFYNKNRTGEFAAQPQTPLFWCLNLAIINEKLKELAISLNSLFRIKSIRILIFLFLSTSIGYSQDSLIKPNKSYENSNCINPMIYKVALQKNEFALINVLQIGTDLAIKTFSPDGRKLDSFDSPNGSSGEELIVIDADTSGIYSIHVEPLNGNKPFDVALEYISQTKDLRAHFSKIIELVSSRGAVPGFACSIVTKDRILFEHTHGFSNIETAAPYTNASVQKLASISKTTIGLSLLILIDQGKLSLDTKINDILPFKINNPYFPNDEITIKQLATHTSGIKEDKFYEKMGISLDDPNEQLSSYSKTLSRVIKKIKSNRLLSIEEYLKSTLIKGGKYYKKKNFLKKRPGEEWYYSNTGAALAAYIVENVSGMSYAAFTHQYIFEPLGLESAAWFNKNSDPNQVVEYYTCRNEKLPKINTSSYPDGELHLSPDDLTKYLQFLMQGYYGENKILGLSSFKEMMSTQYEGQFGDRKVTSGIFWEFFKGGTMGHNGGDNGILTLMQFNPITGIGFTYMTNTLVVECPHTYAEYLHIWRNLKRYGSKLNEEK